MLAVTTSLTDQQFEQFDRDGYLVLGRTMADEELAGLQQRLSDITEGRIHYDGLGMQSYEAADNATDARRFRKLGPLWLDDRYLAYFQKALFGQIMRRYYGQNVAIQRAMLFNNFPGEAKAGISYHQDGGDSWNWNYQPHPFITIWTAIDRATVENGCVHVLPGTHQKLIPHAEVDQIVQRSTAVPIELEAGEAALLHNWTLHGSFANTSDHPRQAVTVCYADAITRRKDGKPFDGPVVFGEGAVTSGAPARARREDDAVGAIGADY